MSMVHASAGRNKPASEHLLSEPAIVAGMARATLGQRTVIDSTGFVSNHDRVRDGIEDVVPIFQNSNARIRIPGGFHLASNARERVWSEPSGKAHFLVFHDGLGEDAIEDDLAALWLSTVRSHDQYNTTIYSMSDRYRGVYGQRDVVFLNKSELEKRGLQDSGRSRYEIDRWYQTKGAQLSSASVLLSRRLLRGLLSGNQPARAALRA